MLISQDRRGERKNTFGSFRYIKKMEQENTDAYEDVQFTITLGKESSLV